MDQNIYRKFTLLVLILALVSISYSCSNPCYSSQNQDTCPSDPYGQQSYTLHMSVHPHLDAYWIFDFDSYYDPKPNQGQVHGYFASNRFHSVKQIFDTTTRVLKQSKQHRQKYGSGSQKAHRSFFNSEMGFFKHWFNSQSLQIKNTVKSLLKTKYWEIVGGGFVQHDQGCAYYDDIIQNFQIGLKFLKDEFNYFPKAAISADSFGHSQTTLAILAHIGVEGFFVQRSDQHILLQNKTQFIWKAKSSNQMFYGALPTHIRWAIHGFEDQFIGGGGNQNFCTTKQNYINNLRRQNQFMKRILKSSHIMRYFGHDFQQFDQYSYNVIEGMMEKFSTQKCKRVVSVYGNPTQYFMTLMGEVFGKKVKPIATRTEDIFPIWDYDSGLYWTGYYTTDPYHKKNYRDAGRFLHAIRKFFTPYYIIKKGTAQIAQEYEVLQQLAQQVAYLQHHDGVSGTSKYKVMNQLQVQNENLIGKIKSTTLKKLFQNQFQNTVSQQFQFCNFTNQCKISNSKANNQQIILNIFNSAGYDRKQPIIVILPYDTYFIPDCPYEMNCFCQQLPCECSLYLYPQVYGTYVQIILKKKKQIPLQLGKFTQLGSSQTMFSHNNTHLKITLNSKTYSIGYKKIIAQATGRSYDHLSRYGDQIHRSFSIRPGKYALGNNPNKISDLTQIRKVLKLQTKKNIFLLVLWQRDAMKTFISISKATMNEWKVETLSAAEGQFLQDLYFQVQTEIINDKVFYTDSNGWLVMKRQLFKHQDYQAHFDPNKYDDIDGNSYPMTAFAFIQDAYDKVSINTDRAQGFISYQKGTLWANFDRLSSDDGKWVYENTNKNQYQRFSHTITVQNNNFNQRKIQALYDMPNLIQINYFLQPKIIQKQTFDIGKKQQWLAVSNIDGIKSTIKAINDSTIVLRVHNLNDKTSKNVGLYVQNVCPFLTSFFGNQVQFESIEERSLGNNMNYNKFIQRKWNWNSVVDLTNENNIFNKIFSENITLRPLQIRTFSFSGLSFKQDCRNPSQLKYSGEKHEFALNLTKSAPKRQDPKWEKDIVDYLFKGDKCNVRSPINIDKRYDNEDLQISYQTDSSSDNVFLHKPSSNSQKKQDYYVPIVIQNKKHEGNQVISPIPAQRIKQDVIPNSNKPLQRNPQQPVKQNIDSSSSSKESEEYLIIKKKIQNLQVLTKQQKEKYFERRLKQIQEVRQRIQKMVSQQQNNK